jgi:hypothetical protein
MSPINSSDEAEVFIMRKDKLRSFKTNIKNFFKEFKNYQINEISDEKLQQFLNAHKLNMTSCLTEYVETYKSNLRG